MSFCRKQCNATKVAKNMPHRILVDLDNSTTKTNEAGSGLTGSEWRQTPINKYKCHDARAMFQG